MRVSRKKATHQSGPKKGKLKKGCKFVKGGAVCKSGVAGVGKARRRKRK